MQISNLSDRNAFVRFTTGTTMTAYGIAGLSRNSSCNKARAMVLFGAMKMAEGIFHYCPVKAVLKANMQSSITGMLTDQNPDMAKIIQDFAKIVSEGSTTKSASGKSSSSSTAGVSASKTNGSTSSGSSSSSSNSTVKDKSSSSVNANASNPVADALEKSSSSNANTSPSKGNTSSNKSPGNA